MPDSKKQILMILGMHRSGTSAVTRVSNLLGFPLGEEFISTNEYNRRGFWEHKQAVSIHERILSILNYSWDDIRAMPENIEELDILQEEKEALDDLLYDETRHRELWAVKDPRMCRLLPLWIKTIELRQCRPKALIVVRNPVETALSLAKRDQMSQEKALLLWLRYNLEAEYYTRNIPRCFVYYSDFLEDWCHQIKRIGKTLSIEWPVPIDEAASGIDAFLDNGLKHNHIDEQSLLDNPDIMPMVKQAFLLLKQCINDDSHECHNQFDQISQSLTKVSHEYDQAITDAIQGNSSTYQAYREYQKANEQLQSSLQQYQQAYDEFIQVHKPKYEQQIADSKQETQDKQQELQKLCDQYNQLEDRYRKNLLDYDQLQRNYDTLKQNYTKVIHSFSWTITKPLRVFKQWLLELLAKRNQKRA